MFSTDFVVKLVRYSLVSVVVVPTGSLLMWLFLRAGVQPVYANLLSVAVTTPISYVLNRRWTWQRDGITGGAGEVVAFWWLAAIGLVLSSSAVSLASLWTPQPEALVAVNISTYGIVWVLKFFILDRCLFVRVDERTTATSLMGPLRASKG